MTTCSPAQSLAKPASSAALDFGSFASTQVMARLCESLQRLLDELEPLDHPEGVLG
jgi:hypothetical protein